MEKIDKIQIAIRRWNPWWLADWQKVEYVNREIKEEFIKLITLRQIKDLMGVRRCGKTTFLIEIVNEWMRTGIDAQHILLLNCDDFIIKEANFDDLLKAIKILSPKISYIILDEIQEKLGWEHWIRTLYDTNQFQQIIITGSNASLLSQDIGRVLSGRHISIILTPFSFREYLWSKHWYNFGIADVVGNLDVLQHHLEQYFKEGGFPEPNSKENEYEKNQILLHLANDIISRDVLMHYNVDPQKIKQLFQYVMTNFTHEFSLRKISKVLKIHPDTINIYLNCLKECFAIEILPIFAYKLTQQFQENKKIYVIDSGLRNTVSFQNVEDKGKHAENVVFWTLYREKKEIYYWKDEKHEVDFVISKGMTVLQLIQVCWSMEDAKVVKREKDALVAAAHEFDVQEGYVITAYGHSDENYQGITIHTIRLIEWLLLRQDTSEPHKNIIT